jgi:hypothetical protein
MGNGLISNGQPTPAYQMFLQVNEVYQYLPPHCAEILFRTPELGSIQFPKGTWHNFVLHVYFSQRACNNGSPCNWIAPNGGVMELWIDHVYKGSWARITDYAWPNPWACDADRIAGFPTSGPMPIYLKLGIYRNPDITYDESWFFNGVMAATTCSDVWGAGASPTCPRF